jgi:hypothetical protein
VANLAVLYRSLGRTGDALREAQVAARLDAAKLARTSASGPAEREGLGLITIGMITERAQRALGSTPTRVLPVAMGLGDDVHIQVYDPIGVTLVVRHGRVEAAMAREGYRGRLGRGLGLGAPGHEVEARYGRPTDEDGLQERRLWIYPAQRIVVFLQAGRVAGWWVH